MDRYTTTRFALRIGIFAFSINPALGPAQSQALVVDSLVEQPAVHRQDPGYMRMEADHPEQQRMALPDVTGIVLVADSLPAARSVSRPPPPLPAPRSHDMERDVRTLRVAHAAMRLDDRLRERKMAALR